MPKINNRSRRCAVLLAALMMLSSCSYTTQTFTTGQQLLAEGKIEEGLETLQRAMEEEPRNQDYRSYYFRQRETIINQLLFRGEEARIANDWAGAEAHYRRALALDPANVRARAGLERVAHGPPAPRAAGRGGGCNQRAKLR